MRSAARKWTASKRSGLQIGSQLVKGGAIQQGTGMALVLVLFDEHIATVICRFSLTQVVEGYTSPHDHDAARRGIEWMREHC